MAAYYNEIDPFAAAWLRRLIERGLIAAGDVDERDIREVQADDVRGYTQCHFFAGIGGWSYALRLAGWPDSEPVWTGSCPCQPFSNAGRAQGVLDERHLWPAFQRLISECRPATAFGEQVASKAGREWLAGIRADLEALGYAVGASDLCAAVCGSPQVSSRLWWVAETGSKGVSRFVKKRQHLRSAKSKAPAIDGHGGLLTWLYDCANPDTIGAADGLRRPVGEVRAFGNAIVPQIAAEFIGAYMDCKAERES